MKSSEKTLAREKEFRELIWTLDRGRDRCWGYPLYRRSGLKYLGQVCHLKPRSLYPELKYEPTNAFLLNAYLHAMSDARGGYRLKIIGDDARKPLRFVMRNHRGEVLWERIG